MISNAIKSEILVFSLRMFFSLDFLIIISYTLILLAIGFFSSRKQSRESFLISERNITTLSGFATINATKTGAIIFIFTALLYEYGFSAMWYFIGIVLGYIVFFPFARTLFEKSNKTFYTLADYFFKTYGRMSGFLASGLTILIMVGFLIINLIAATKILQFFTGFNFTISAVLIAFVVLAYLILAGFHAVVKTDIFQYGAVVCILAAFALFLGNGIEIPAHEWTFFSAGTADIFGFLLIGVLFPFASPDLWQRVYAIKDIKTLRKSLILSIVMFGVVGFILALVGLFIKSALPGLDPDFALVIGLTELLPIGLSGLALVVFFAALMSSIDTYVYTASSAVVQDFGRYVSQERTVAYIRIVIAITLVLSTVVAILVQDLIKVSFIFASFVVVLAVPTLVTWVRPAVTALTLNIAFIIGTVLLVVIAIADFTGGTLSPAIVLKGVGGSVIGLTVGVLVSKVWHLRNS